MILMILLLLFVYITYDIQSFTIFKKLSYSTII